jgi:hypothetical protein
VVNVLQGHPFDPVLATVGIDNTVKVLQPVRAERNPLVNEEGIRKENMDRVRFFFFLFAWLFCAHILARNAWPSYDNLSGHAQAPTPGRKLR